MNDKDLADKIVVCEVLEWHEAEGIYYCFKPFMALSATQAVRDWRVAGALMEKIPGNELRISAFGQAISDMQVGDCISRAINEACVEALQNS